MSNSITTALVFTITRFFDGTSWDSPTQGAFRIRCDNVVNPRNMVQVKTFKIDITDSNGCAIESTNTDIAVQMDKVPSFTNMGAVSSG